MTLTEIARTSLIARLALLLAASLVGCNSAPKYTFQVSLKNASPEPVTVWLTKTGGPEESEWLAPEAMAGSRAASVDAINGIVIPPGKTGDIGPLAGRFNPDSDAVLRVYAGKLTFNQLLATSADGKLRIDVPLHDGTNHLTVNPEPPLHVDRDEATK